MAQKSLIEWTEATWNPVTGCTKISDGCAFCYAERLAIRLKAMGQKNYRNGFEVTLHPNSLTLPLKWKKSQRIFVNSMSDLFHEDIPDAFIMKVFDVMNRAYWHNFQILTKRAERLAQLAPSLSWTENIWIGVTVESASYTHRLDHLRKIPAKIRFLSLEPLLGPLPEVDLTNINWVIVGGESGPRSRPMNKEWVIKIRQKCLKLHIPFFFKQWGGINKKKAGRLLDGKLYNEIPEFKNEASNPLL